MTSVEPEPLMDACGALWQGFLAVVATLRLEFARAVTLGASIGDVLA